jgi:hypothetical protein
MPRVKADASGSFASKIGKQTLLAIPVESIKDGLVDSLRDVVEDLYEWGFLPLLESAIEKSKGLLVEEMRKDYCLFPCQEWLYEEIAEAIFRNAFHGAYLLSKEGHYHNVLMCEYDIAQVISSAVDMNMVEYESIFNQRRPEGKDDQAYAIHVAMKLCEKFKFSLKVDNLKKLIEGMRKEIGDLQLTNLALGKGGVYLNYISGYNKEGKPCVYDVYGFEKKEMDYLLGVTGDILTLLGILKRALVTGHPDGDDTPFDMESYRDRLISMTKYLSDETMTRLKKAFVNDDLVKRIYDMEIKYVGSTEPSRKLNIRIVKDEGQTTTSLWLVFAANKDGQVSYKGTYAVEEFKEPKSPNSWVNKYEVVNNIRLDNLDIPSDNAVYTFPSITECDKLPPFGNGWNTVGRNHSDFEALVNLGMKPDPSHVTYIIFKSKDIF